MSYHTPESPNFFSADWLRTHIFQTIEFYYPQCMDEENGGYFHCFRDDGSVCDTLDKPLVGIARFIYNFSIGALLGGPLEWRLAAEQGLRFLNRFFRDSVHGGYYWHLKGRIADDPKKIAYGHAFVLLAVSTAVKAGIKEVRKWIEDIYNVLENRFWDGDHGLYIEERSADWQTVSPYRGQNPNMHLCEALIAAFEATGCYKYLERARGLAYAVTVGLAAKTGGMIWEQYDRNWNPDWFYHEEYAGNEFRLYGFILGHSIEWSKLLLKLSVYYSESWITRRAYHLYHCAMALTEDSAYGGLLFSILPAGCIFDADKYYWVMAEAIGASVLFAGLSRHPYYLQKYQSLFLYCDRFFIDHKYGGWYNRLNRENQRTSPVKSPPPKTDYHPIANCYEALRVFSGERFRNLPHFNE
ncbi:AGE family epimerase/isomerase [Sporolactobacillus putidus]|uniref:AGE family epimerase/isomerase n=1 Tax=Sporolactobacillus putidus TaxID=492735 RepID=A0A917S202_9BACL|nr:AGE family epimerase/isomerase [Sporolactobacillus putidus]GGL51825.1 AGE family epimerase/isomerase [Sporolactobacillus putidus]